jgi:hypothetical protein
METSIFVTDLAQQFSLSVRPSPGGPSRQARIMNILGFMATKAHEAFGMPRGPDGAPSGTRNGGLWSVYHVIVVPNPPSNISGVFNARTTYLDETSSGRRKQANDTDTTHRGTVPVEGGWTNQAFVQ